MIFKNLTFDGISLKEYGVYISGEAVFDSPTREVEMITIPGRNGSFALDKGRFNNITVTYPAGIYATNETEFAEKVSTLRNLLASRKGYCRLTDEYNPDEFRLGVYKAGLELDPTHYNEAGRFELSFDCKPQRFLFSGEEVFTLGEWGQTETHSGSIVSFEGDETTAIKSLTAQIVPKQAGSGDPSPSNIRSISGYDTVNIHVSPTTTAGDGNTYPISLGQTVYGGTLDVVSGKLNVDWVKVDMGSLNWGVWNGKFVASLPDAYQSLTGSIPLVSEIYKTGQWGSSASQGEDMIWITGSTSNAEVYVQDSTYTDKTTFKTAVTGKYMAYKLKTATEITLTPTEVNTLLGQNNIWADSGDVTVEIGQNPNVLFNPTLFEACPLIEFNASEEGEINIGNRQIKVLNSYIGYIPLNLSANNNEVTINNTSSFNSGDIIKFNGASINVEYASNGQSWIPYVTARDGLDGTGYLPREGGWGISPKSTEMTFTAGTSSTVTQSLDVKVVRQYTTPATEETHTFTLSVAYDGADKFTITWTIPTYTVYPTYRTADRSNYVGSVNSTKSSLENVDIYIDLDIGEAYSIDSDDNVVSLNNFVNLGGELPTLEPGATEITTDSSISNVKVTPRWWKV